MDGKLAITVLRNILSLGFVGAIITAAVLVYRARIQPIQYDSEVHVVTMDDAARIKVVIKTPQGEELLASRFYIAHLHRPSASDQSQQ